MNDLTTRIAEVMARYCMKNENYVTSALEDRQNALIRDLEAELKACRGKALEDALSSCTDKFSIPESTAPAVDYNDGVDACRQAIRALKGAG